MELDLTMLEPINRKARLARITVNRAQGVVAAKEYLAMKKAKRERRQEILHGVAIIITGSMLMLMFLMSIL